MALDPLTPAMAQAVRRLTFDPDARPDYEGLSDGRVWPDEWSHELALACRSARDRSNVSGQGVASSSDSARPRPEEPRASQHRLCSAPARRGASSDSTNQSFGSREA